jgi:hypothetical protein
MNRRLLGALVGALAVAALAVVSIVPLWCSELLPYQDAPQHLAAIRHGHHDVQEHEVRPAAASCVGAC